LNAVETGDLPLLSRVAGFPLTAMVISIAVYLGAIGIGLLIGRYLVETPLGNVRLRTAIDVISLIVVVLVIGAYKLIVGRLGEHPHDDLPLASGPKNLALGLLVGLAIMSVIVALSAALGVYRITAMGTSNELMHELIGIVFRWIEEFAGSWVGLALSSIAFGFVHYYNPNSTVIADLAIAVEAGVLLGGAYILTRSLWVPVGIHAGWNFAEGEIFGVPDSGIPVHGLLQAKFSGPEFLTGGGFGLEASLITFGVATAVGVSIVVFAVRRGQVVQPWWVRGRSTDVPTAQI
jgi:membrane protease YdiL (CAAX protease family)